jgi:hypothetical protein
MAGNPAAEPTRHESAALVGKPTRATNQGAGAGTRIPGPVAVPVVGTESGAGPEPEGPPEPESLPSGAAPKPQAEAPSAHAEDSATSLPQLARALGGVVAPTTLLTGLLYYFGWLHAYYLFGYFGVNSTTLGFGTVDYLMRSVDALYIPLTVASIIALLALWGNEALLPVLRAGPPKLRSRFLGAVTVLGLALTVVGGALTLLIGGGGSGYAALAPVGFASGVVVLGYAVHVRRVLPRPGEKARAASGWAGTVEWMITFLLVAISLFAAASDYAGGVGVTRARQLVAELPSQPAVVVYSQHDLDLPSIGITETRCASPDAGYRYRYDGLVLVLESGGKYVLLPRQWTRDGQSPAILLAESDAIRLEFYPGTVAPAPSPTAC